MYRKLFIVLFIFCLVGSIGVSLAWDEQDPAAYLPLVVLQDATTTPSPTPTVTPTATLTPQVYTKDENPDLPIPDGPTGVVTGTLEQQTLLQPTELITDTTGYSDVVFGLFWLLGYQFSPRLADLGSTRYWRIKTETNYGALEGVARHRINQKLIRQNWDDLLRVAGSLKLGTVSASALIRTLQPGRRASTLSQSIGEVGRIAKTLYLLAYLDDEGYRRRILTQLNRGETRHSLARVIFHGQRGEVRQRYRAGQEEPLGALRGRNQCRRCCTSVTLRFSPHEYAGSLPF